MKKFLVLVFVFTCFGELQSQSNSNYQSTNYGTRNYNSSLNSFKYGIIGTNQDATGSPTGLVSAIIRRVPSAKKNHRSIWKCKFVSKRQKLSFCRRR